MQKVYPDYYKEFKCIKNKCRHNCCIGWEIDIDRDTAEYYLSVEGELGDRLRESIAADTEPHFVLCENERCPFLNSENLCDIILGIGEDKLCTICTEHPRFHSNLPHRTESGLGLCCEEAARIILSKQSPVRLIIEGKDSSPYEDEIVVLRDKVIEALQKREKSVPERICDMLKLCDCTASDKPLLKWAELLISLERLSQSWTELLNLLYESAKKLPLQEFDLYMKNRQTEYEQLLVYIIYRHFANCSDQYEYQGVAAFAAFTYTLIHSIGASLYLKNGSFTFEEQVELCRLFSSEIEYSDENLQIILNHLYPPYTHL